jgi:glycosyltransferase involved in cell wall biosynthesis
MRFLRDQLSSIAAQTHQRWSIIASDDGSRDGTVDLLREFAREYRNQVLVRIRTGRRKGATENFLSLITDLSINAEFFAYCDQDDVWAQNKLARAVGWLSSVPKHVPALYCSSTTYIDDAGMTIGASPRFARPPNFRNAIVQNIAGGNTMVFNQAARALLAGAGVVNVVSHDWWTYAFVTGVGGRVHYDRVPTVQYRQHSCNVVGARLGLRGFIARIARLTSAEVAIWNARNTAALSSYAHLLLPENRAVLRSFSEMRSPSLVRRLRGYASTMPYRQTMLGQVSLVVAVIAGRL